MKLPHHDHILNFGKYKGLTIEQVYKEDNAYLIWLTKNLDKDDFSIIIGYIKAYIKAKNESLTYAHCLAEVIKVLESGKDHVITAKEIISIVKTY